MLLDKQRRVPSGLVAFGVQEAQRKIWASSTLADLFGSFGYERVIPPTITYGSDLDQERLEGLASLKLPNRLGEDLRLRSDITLAVTQSVANRYQKQDMPLRFYYTENVFQDIAPGTGHLREKTQAGIELFGGGDKGPHEILYLAQHSAQSLLNQDFRIVLSHVGILRAMMQIVAKKTPLPIKTLRQIFVRRDWVYLQKQLSGFDSNFTNSLLTVCFAFGKKEALTKIQTVIKQWPESQELTEPLEQALKSVSDLMEIWQFLEANDISDSFYFDFGLFKNLDYYSGIIIEGYTSRVGCPILSGGCYDNLIKQFSDMQVSAVGFALDLDFILPVLTAQKENSKREFVTIFSKKGV